jgi:transcription initiation factor TFIID subunit 2
MKSASQPKPMPPPPVPIQAKPVAAPTKAPATPAATIGTATPTPTLKLKIGGNLALRATPPAPSDNTITPKTAISVKPKGRKPKPADTPLAAVVDDGSFDLLEEVIAIEKEKERLVASKKQRQSTAGLETVTPVKRKKDLLEELEEDEEILALASPSKKPSRSPQPISIEKEVRAASPAKVPGSINVKRASISVSEPAVNPEVKPPAESRRSPSKGKEKEVSSPAPTRLSAASETPINKGKAREVLKNLLKLPEAAIFSRPVDPIQDGCPTCSLFVARMLALTNPMLSAGTLMRSRILWILAR